MIDILNGLNIEKVYFFGILMGGMIVLWFGIYYVDCFYSIIVVNLVVKIWNEEGWNVCVDVVIVNGLVDLVMIMYICWFSE